MFGKQSLVTPLDLRKQLLIAESEINRVRLTGDVAALASDIRAITVRAKSLGWVASCAARLATVLATIKSRPTAGVAKSSWMQTVIKGAGLITTLWLSFRSSGAMKNKQDE